MCLRRVFVLIGLVTVMLGVGATPTPAATNGSGAGSATWTYTGRRPTCAISSDGRCREVRIVLAGIVAHGGTVVQARIVLASVLEGEGDCPLLTFCPRLSQNEPVTGRTPAGAPVRGTCTQLRKTYVTVPLGETELAVGFRFSASCSIRIGSSPAFPWRPLASFPNTGTSSTTGAWYALP
jgi:hypothetical protein